MKHDDLRAAVADLEASADDLVEAVEQADGAATAVFLAEAIVAASKATKRLTRLREQLGGKGKKGGK